MRIRAFLTVAALVAAPALAADLEPAIRALGRGNLAQAESILMPLAQSGDVPAQALLGHTYAAQERYLDSYAWLHVAAQCGSVDARIDRTMISRKMSRAAITKAETRGNDLLEKHCPPM